jgi:hypothetical protein
VKGDNVKYHEFWSVPLKTPRDISYRKLDGRTRFKSNKPIWHYRSVVLVRSGMLSRNEIWSSQGNKSTVGLFKQSVRGCGSWCFISLLLSFPTCIRPFPLESLPNLDLHTYSTLGVFPVKDWVPSTIRAPSTSQVPSLQEHTAKGQEEKGRQNWIHFIIFRRYGIKITNISVYRTPSSKWRRSTKKDVGENGVIRGCPCLDNLRHMMCVHFLKNFIGCTVYHSSIVTLLPNCRLFYSAVIKSSTKNKSDNLL